MSRTPKPLLKSWSQGGYDVCPVEVVALEQQRFVKRMTRQMSVLDGERFFCDASPSEEHVALAHGLQADLGFEKDGEFQEIAAAHRAVVSVVIMLVYWSAWAASADVSSII